LLFPLFAADLALQSFATSVVCVFLGIDGAAFALVVAFGAAVLAGMATTGDERSGEGGRPAEGVIRDESGSLRFSLGFLNMDGTAHIWKRGLTTDVVGTSEEYREQDPWNSSRAKETRQHVGRRWRSPLSTTSAEHTRRAQRTSLHCTILVQH
jgi:hypothetical protein